MSSNGGFASDDHRPSAQTMRTPDHHEFARLLKITDAPDGYNIIPLVVEEDDRLDAFVRPQPYLCPPSILTRPDRVTGTWTSSFQTNSVLMEASDDDLRPFWVSLR